MQMWNLALVQFESSIDFMIVFILILLKMSCIKALFHLINYWISSIYSNKFCLQTKYVLKKINERQDNKNSDQTMDYLNVNPVIILNWYENSDWIQNFAIKKSSETEITIYGLFW